MAYHYQADKTNTVQALSKVAKEQGIKPTYRGILEGLGITHISHYNSVNIAKNPNIRNSLDKPNKRLNGKNPINIEIIGFRKSVILAISKFNDFCRIKGQKLKKPRKGCLTNKKGGFYY